MQSIGAYDMLASGFECGPEVKVTPIQVHCAGLRILTCASQNSSDH